MPKSLCYSNNQRTKSHKVFFVILSYFEETNVNEKNIWGKEKWEIESHKSKEVEFLSKVTDLPQCSLTLNQCDLKHC